MSRHSPSNSIGSIGSLIKEIHLFVKEQGGAPWKMCGVVGSDQQEFEFLAKRDGEYAFTMVTVDTQGRSIPADVRNDPPGLIVVTLKDGPFRHLHGEWRFIALAPHACKIEFELAYEFSTTVLDGAIGPVFSYIANSLIDAFVHRAEACYGPAKA